MKLCDYGCGREAKYYFKIVKKWCCSKYVAQCPIYRNKNSNYSKELHKDPQYKEKHSFGLKLAWSNLNNGFLNRNEKLSKSIQEAWKRKTSKYHTNEYKRKRSIIMKNQWNNPNGKINSKDNKKKQSINIKNRWKNSNYKQMMKKKITKSWKHDNTRRINYDFLVKYHPFFCIIENPIPDKESGLIKIHCKNSKCKYSKENGNRFVPTLLQIFERIRQLESKYGNGGSYFYCCEKCKKECALFNLKSDPYKNNDKLYIPEEYQTFREIVLKRDDYKCIYCGEKAEHVHHTRPQKLEPFFSLDPDFGIFVCKDILQISSKFF